MIESLLTGRRDPDEAVGERTHNPAPHSQAVVRFLADFSLAPLHGAPAMR